MKFTEKKLISFITIFTLLAIFAGFAVAEDKPTSKDSAKDKKADDYYDEEQAGGISYEEEVVTLDQADIFKVIKGRLKSINGCYETQLQTNQDLVGRLKVSFEIQLNGTVKGVKVAKGSTMKDKKVVKCVLKIVKSLRFTERKKGDPIPVNIPFNFQKKKDQ